MSQALGHRLIIKTAVEMAEVAFEELMRHDAAYAEFKEKQKLSGLPQREIRRAFIARMTPFFIQKARTTLAELLTTPIAEPLKEQISDALIKDHAFQASRSF